MSWCKGCRRETAKDKCELCGTETEREVPLVLSAALSRTGNRSNRRRRVGCHAVIAEFFKLPL
jgi:rRNA maturation protein Nop10